MADDGKLHTVWGTATLIGVVVCTLFVMNTLASQTQVKEGDKAARDYTDQKIESIQKDIKHNSEDINEIKEDVKYIRKLLERNLAP